MAIFYLFVFHDVINRRTYIINNVYEEVEWEYIGSLISVQIDLSLVEDHDFDTETLLIHCFRKVIKTLMSLSEWFDNTALYAITVKIQVLNQYIFQQERLLPVQYINRVYEEVDSIETSIDWGYESEDESTTIRTISSVYYSSGIISTVFSSIRSYNVSSFEENEIEANDIEDNVIEDQDPELVSILNQAINEDACEDVSVSEGDEEDVIEDQDTELVSILNQTINKDARKDFSDDEDSEEDTDYYNNYKFYKTFKRH